MKQFTGTMSHFANKQDYFEAKAEFYEDQVTHLDAKFEETLDVLVYAHMTGEWAYDRKKVSTFIKEMSKDDIYG